MGADLDPVSKRKRERHDYGYLAEYRLRWYVGSKIY